MWTIMATAFVTTGERLKNNFKLSLVDMGMESVLAGLQSVKIGEEKFYKITHAHVHLGDLIKENSHFTTQNQKFCENNSFC